jgi:hypothetical protein
VSERPDVAAAERAHFHRLFRRARHDLSPASVWALIGSRSNGRNL